jgi:hypothetical protein
MRSASNCRSGSVIMHEEGLQANTCGLQTAYPVQSLLDNSVGDAVSTLGRLDKTLCGVTAAVGLLAHDTALPPSLCPACVHLDSRPHTAPGYCGSRAGEQPHGVQPRGPVRGKRGRIGGGDALGMRKGGTRA